MQHTLVKVRPTFHGYIDSTADVLLVLQAVLDGKLAPVERRPYEIERSQLIVSGNVFVFIEELSRIRRWTDGVRWSPSRILGKFLVYRELDKHRRGGPAPLRPNGLIKKALSLHLYDPGSSQRQTFHLISYYSKRDLHARALSTPSHDPFFQYVRPCPQLVDALENTTIGGASRAATTAAVAATAGSQSSSPASPAGTPMCAPTSVSVSASACASVSDASSSAATRASALPLVSVSMPALNAHLPAPLSAGLHPPQSYYYQQPQPASSTQISRSQSPFALPNQRQTLLPPPRLGKPRIQLPSLVNSAIPPPLPVHPANIQLHALPPYQPMHTQPRAPPNFSDYRPPAFQQQHVRIPLPPHQANCPPFLGSDLPPVAHITSQFQTDRTAPSSNFHFIS
ncbi:LAQU0S04e04610g1_1 [Lachancea quebecensis]|uniref:LAQU0S04e04610g1_1 n=1 Tax=Lachancea quebecensis TaxID=1654605 RepID=A0A0P1KQ45_9SACH|nr:LAQU0S04e04610g1_1 [Lachancea quebecensis]